MKFSFFLYFIFLLSHTSCHPTAQSSTSQQPTVQNPSDKPSMSILIDKKWKVDAPIFFQKERKKYQLNAVDNSPQHLFGHFVSFKKDGSFQGYYTAPCGNDCFTFINGSYHIRQQALEVFIDSARQAGFCETPIQYKNQKRGAYKIIMQHPETILLQHI